MHKLYTQILNICLFYMTCVCIENHQQTHTRYLLYLHGKVQLQTATRKRERELTTSKN